MKPSKQPLDKRKSRRKKVKPDLPWQVGKYARFITERHHIPYQLLLMCKLLDIPPMELVSDFFHNAALASWDREGKEDAREKVVEYLIACGYGRKHYSETDIRLIFKEADAQGMLWPKNASRNVQDICVAWREKYHTHWFEQWFWKSSRKL
jgi:hypothetical protein